MTPHLPVGTAGPTLVAMPKFTAARIAEIRGHLRSFEARAAELSDGSA